MLLTYLTDAYTHWKLNLINNKMKTKLLSVSKALLAIFLAFSSMPSSAVTKIYCAPNGSSNGNGTLSSPYDFVTAVGKLASGDTLYCRGGVYNYSSSISLKCKSGTADYRTAIFAYPGETPVFDFRKQAYGKTGISTSADYIHIKGLTIRYAGKNGLHNSGAYNIFELLDVYGCGDTGVQMKGAGGHNLILNCDSHDNFDYKLDKSGNLTSADFGGNADGFADKQYTGEGNTYRGCRAWNNSDDGWDCYQRVSGTTQTIVENCICYNNGPYTYDMTGHPRYEVDKDWFDKFKGEGIDVTMRHGDTRRVTIANYANEGNANGFKMGGDYTRHNFTVRHCLAVGNNARGLDQNNNDGKMYFYNNTCYNNVHNVGMNNPSYGSAVLYNNISLHGDKELKEPAESRGDQLNCREIVCSNNTWDIEGLELSESDFMSLDTTLILSPRNADGSLPEIPFMRLVKGSRLIDAGTANTGLAFYGSAPDLGCYEYEEGTEHIAVSMDITGPVSQTVRAGRNIATVTVTAGGGAKGIMQKDATDIEGVTVTIKGLSATVSGTPATPGTYSVILAPVVDYDTEQAVTLTITVTDPTAPIIAYVTTSSTSVPSADTKIVEAIRRTFEVKLFDASSSSNDYSDCDALVISSLPSSGLAGVKDLKNNTLPTLLLKPWMMKSSVWNWATAVNTSSPNVDIVKADHKIFTGLDTQGGTLCLIGTVSGDALSYISSYTNCSGVTPLATVSGKDCIAELTGATMNGTKISQKYIVMGIHESSMATATADAQTLVNNAVHYILGREIPGTSDISTILGDTPDSHSNDVYNTAGQRVGTNARGIVISNGRKSIIR